jgi:hypothetical protein
VLSGKVLVTSIDRFHKTSAVQIYVCPFTVNSMLLLASAVHVIVGVLSLVAIGVFNITGATGGAVSIVRDLLATLLTFQKPSVAVAVIVYVPSAKGVTTEIDQTPLTALVVYVTPSITTVIVSLP